METNYVYAFVQTTKYAAETPAVRRFIRGSRSPIRPPSSFTHLKFSFSYKVRHVLLHQPEDAELPSTVLRRSQAATVKHTAWLGTTAVFQNQPQILYKKFASIFTNLGVDEKSHQYLFDKLVDDVRRASATVSPKLMILPLRVVVIRDHLILIGDEEDDEQKEGSVGAEE